MILLKIILYFYIYKLIRKTNRASLRINSS